MEIFGISDFSFFFKPDIFAPAIMPVQPLNRMAKTGMNDCIVAVV